jgi:hypothetical protein
MLESKRLQLDAQRAGLEGQINAVLGAIQFCDALLAEVDAPAPVSMDINEATRRILAGGMLDGTAEIA